MNKRTINIFFIMAIYIISYISVFAQQSDQQTLAILNFDNNSISEKEKLEPLRKGLSDMLNTEMSKINAFKVVERKQLQSLLQEISLSQSGVIDASNAQQIGKLLGAQSLLMGGFVNMFGGQMRIDVRIVEVETGVTLKAVEETGHVDDLFEMVKELTKKITKYFDVKLSKQDKERLKVHRGSENFEATMFYSKGIEHQDQGLLYLKSGNNDAAKQEYQKAISMFEKAREKSNKFEDANMKIKEMQTAIKEL